MKQLFLLFLITNMGLRPMAQVAINSTGNQPAASSMLDVNSSSKGMLMPRMTSAQRKAIQNPETGLLVFDVDRQTIYFFNGQKWKPMMVATDETAPLASKQPEGAKEFSHFGFAVDIYEDYVVVGAPADSAKGIVGGAAYIFYRENGNWKQQAKISAPVPIAGERFGEAVSINGNLIVIGAPEKKAGGMTSRGAAYVFKRIGHVWSYAATLNPSNGAANDNFGTAISTNGTYVIVGAPFCDHNGKTNAGSAYVFGLQNGVWTQKMIINATDPFTEAKFGYSVDIWQTKLAVGAPAASVPHNGNTNGGAVYVYNNTDAAGFTWIFAQKLHPFGYTHNNMEFGYAIALEENTLIVGAPNYSSQGGGYDGTLGVGCIIRFKFEEGTWKYINLVLDYNELHRTGTKVALTNAVYMGGMPKSNEGSGKVMIMGSYHGYLYDEDPNLKYNFGGALAAHNGFIVVASTINSRYGRVFFGTVEP